MRLLLYKHHVWYKRWDRKGLTCERFMGDSVKFFSNRVKTLRRRHAMESLPWTGSLMQGDAFRAHIQWREPHLLVALTVKILVLCQAESEAMKPFLCRKGKPFTLSKMRRGRPAFWGAKWFLVNVVEMMLPVPPRRITSWHRSCASHSVGGGLEGQQINICTCENNRLGEGKAGSRARTEYTKLTSCDVTQQWRKAERWDQSRRASS